MEREDQEVARLAQLVKNYFIPPVRTFSLFSTIQLRASMPLFFSQENIFLQNPTKNTIEKFKFFTDGKPANVRGFSETPVGIF